MLEMNVEDIKEAVQRHSVTSIGGAERRREDVFCVSFKAVDKEKWSVI